MCGRYQLQLDATAVATLHQGAAWREGHASRHAARNQVRPTTTAPVLVRPGATAAPGVTADIVLMRWGMASPGPSARALINARRETLLQLPTFRRTLLQRNGGHRCVVPATGFYEWYKPLGSSRTAAEPFLISRTSSQVTSEPANMFMAGLYEVQDTEHGQETRFVIITTSACDEFAWLHDRQPCFLDSKDEIQAWLDVGRVPAEEAVPRLLATRAKISWKRMTSDLTKESENQAKPKAQSEITTFFAPKGSLGVGKQSKSPKNAPKRLPAKVGVASPRLAKKGHLAGKPGGKRKRSVQKTVSTFFR